MAFVITKGYLIDRHDFDVFDEILTFINEYGNKFTCFAAGTRRITSKNARSLIYGNYLEMEIFHSPNPNKLSRLKKVTTISSIDFKYSNNLGLLTISDLLSLTPKLNVKMYYLYQEILADVLMDKDEYMIACYAFLKYLKISKFKFEYKVCANCFNKHDLIAMSFERHGLICSNCMRFEHQMSKDEIELIKTFLESDINLSFSKIKNINFAQLYKKMNSEWQSFKKSFWKKLKKK